MECCCPCACSFPRLIILTALIVATSFLASHLLSEKMVVIQDKLNLLDLSVDRCIHSLKKGKDLPQPHRDVKQIPYPILVNPMDSFKKKIMSMFDFSSYSQAHNLTETVHGIISNGSNLLKKVKSIIET